MKTRKQLRYTIRRILQEDAKEFEQMIQYAADKDQVEKDAKAFAEENDGGPTAEDWIKAFGEMPDDPFAEIEQVSDDQMKVVKILDQEERLEGFTKAYKAVARAFDVPTMSTGAFVAMFRKNGSVEKTIEEMEKIWDDVYPGVWLRFKELVTDDSFDQKNWGLSDKDEKDQSGPPPVEFDEQVEEVEDELADMDDQLDEFMGSLEDFIEEAYEAKDTETYKSLVKTHSLMKKYDKFIHALFEKIITFAEKKKRQDVVELTIDNVAIVLQWCDLRNDQLGQVQKELSAEDENYDHLGGGGNPSEKTMKVLDKFYKETTESFKVIVANIKKNPLKKLDADNILKEARVHGLKILLEIRKNAITKRSKKYTSRRLRG